MLHFYCQQTGCTCDSPQHFVCDCVWFCWCPLDAAAGFLMRMYGSQCGLPSGCPAAEMHTISLTVLSLSLYPSFHWPLLYWVSAVFPLGFFCQILPLQLCLFHVDLAQTHKSSTLPLLACSLEVCTSGLNKCQGSVRGKSHMLHISGLAAFGTTTARFSFITLFNSSFFTSLFHLFLSPTSHLLHKETSPAVSFPPSIMLLLFFIFLLCQPKPVCLLLSITL